MKIDITPLTIDKAVLCTLENETGLKLVLTNFGAAVISLAVPDREGRRQNVTLTYADMDNFYHSEQFFGKTIGRTAGRIPNSILKIGHDTFALESAFGKHTLHGGRQSLAFKLFAFKLVEFGAETKVHFHYISPFGEGGYPGQVAFDVFYTVYDDRNEVLIEYGAATDFPTPINLTNHAYFNLTGDPSKPVLDHVLKMNAPVFFEIDEELILKRPLPVTKVMDFRNGIPLGRHIEDPSLQASRAFGYDHTFKTDQGSITAILCDPTSGRRMTISSDYPAVNVYTDNYPSQKPLDGAPSDHRYAGVAIEPEFVPIDVPSYTVTPEDGYRHYIRWSFDLLPE
ncbi:MAG: aldose epimerase family protein [Bacilli bacterium]